MILSETGALVFMWDEREYPLVGKTALSFSGTCVYVCVCVFEWDRGLCL